MRIDDKSYLSSRISTVHLLFHAEKYPSHASSSLPSNVIINNVIFFFFPLPFYPFLLTRDRSHERFSQWNMYTWQWKEIGWRRKQKRKKKKKPDISLAGVNIIDEICARKIWRYLYIWRGKIAFSVGRSEFLLNIRAQRYSFVTNKIRFELMVKRKNWRQKWWKK